MEPRIVKNEDGTCAAKGCENQATATIELAKREDVDTISDIFHICKECDAIDWLEKGGYVVI